MCEYTAGLGIDFEISVYERISRFCTPLHGVKSREERIDEYRDRCVSPDLSFTIGGKVFHVDCHYRYSMPKSRVELDYPGMYRFKESCFEDIEDEIFVAYGAGGTPYDPEHVIFEPRSLIHGNRIPMTRFRRLEYEFDRFGFEGIIGMYLNRSIRPLWSRGAAMVC